MRRVLISLACVLGCGRAGEARAPEARAREAKPARAKIVVALVVDQLQAEIFAERASALPQHGAFARLAREGTYVRIAMHAHAATDTAPGHAALFTGKPPRETGIVANELVDDGGKWVGVLKDDATKLVDTGGVTAATGSSAARLRIPTIADRLRSKSPEAQIVSVSIKDRAAIFGGGSQPTATLWFDVPLDRFVTSTAFARELPAWARPHATHDAIVALRRGAWTPLDPPWLAAHAKGPDDAPGEGDWGGLDSAFPHDLAHTKHPAAPFRATPFADEAVLALATAAVRARDPARPLFLAISLSANDYVNHVFGPQSHEAWDELLRLDRGLARLFDVLDAEGPWSAVLSSDHGGPKLLPEQDPSAPKPARIFPHALSEHLQARATEVMGKGEWVLGVADPFVFFGKDAAAPDARKKLEDVLVADLEADPRVAKVHRVRAMTDCAPKADDEHWTAICNSVRPEGPGDLYIVVRPGAFFDTRYAEGAGINHGSPYRYDRVVPLFARAPGRVPGGVRRDEALATSYTRTLASLLDVELDGVPGYDLTRP